MPPLENVSDQAFQRNKDLNYVLRATKENQSFVNIYTSKVDDYFVRTDGAFKFIIYDRHSPSFFYSIPYEHIRQILTDEGLLYGNFWKGIIDKGVFKIKGTRQRLNVQQYFQNFSGLILEELSDIRNTLDTLSQINNAEYSGNSVTEGGERVTITTRYERDPRVKQQAISIHGYNCAVCGFNFERAYGEWGRGFAEIHHIKPLSSTGGQEVSTNPLNDVFVVCSNCHSMIHKKRGITLTIHELQSKLSRSS